MRAPREQQLKLLEIQALDTEIKRNLHRLKNIPQVAELEKLKHFDLEVEKKNVQLGTLVADKKRELRRVEADLEQLQSRRQLQQGRLDAGQSAAKELMAIESEIKRIVKRQDELETQQLEIIGEIEKYAQIQAKIDAKKAEIQVRQQNLEAEMGSQMGDLNTAVEDLQRRREALAVGIDTELYETYAEIAAKTGGVGAVKITDLRVENIELEFSAAEASRIRQADPDEVLFSEEYDYILVRA